MRLKIISDGTPSGSKLIDEATGEAVQGVGRLIFEADVKLPLAKVSVEFLGVSVEITTPTNVDLLECVAPEWDLRHAKSFDKEINISSQSDTTSGITRVDDVKITDAVSHQQISAVQSVRWEATPYGVQSELTRVRFDDKDW